MFDSNKMRKNNTTLPEQFQDYIENHRKGGKIDTLNTHIIPAMNGRNTTIKSGGIKLLLWGGATSPHSDIIQSYKEFCT